MSQAEVKFKEGVNFMKEAEKMVSTSFFKWKPDFEGGAGEFQKAANCFKVAKAYEQAKEAFMKSADASYQVGHLVSASQNIENAASMAKQLKRFEEAAQLYERASQIILENGSPDKAAELLAKAGETLKEVSAEKASEYYINSCDLYVTEGREQFGQETFKNTIAILLKLKRHTQALDILKKQSQAYQKQGNRPYLFKSFLSILVVLLSIGDTVEANKQYQSFFSNEGFLSTDEGKACNDLLEAYSGGNQEALDKVAARQTFNFLDHEITRLARNLKAEGGGGGSGIEL